MGWSCTQNANRTLDVWTAKCVEQTGIQNVFITSNGEKRMFETSRVEHADGAITGSYGVLKEDLYYKKGNFRINADGTVKRGVGL